jgi:hypothetical protein
VVSAVLSAHSVVRLLAPSEFFLYPVGGDIP